MKNDAMADKAVEYFNSGFVCAEAVLMAIAEAYEINSPHIPSIATAFGSGLSRSNGPCGALSGGIMALSLLNGRKDGSEDYASLYKNVASLQQSFHTTFKTTECSKLLGFSLADSDAGEKFTQNKCQSNTCNHCVRFVVEEVNRIVQKTE